MKLSKVELAAVTSLILLAASSLLPGCKKKAPAAELPQATSSPAAPKAEGAMAGESTAKSQKYQVTGGFRHGTGK